MRVTTYIIPDLKEAYKNNNLAGQLRKEQPNRDLLLYKQKLYLLPRVTEGVIRDHHDDPLLGHPGVSKTLELIQRVYAAPNLRASVEQYIRECICCQQNKSARHAKYGQIQFAEVPDTLWKDVTMDFVMKLPRLVDPVTNDKYDLIMVIVDKLTKYAIMIPYKESYNAS